MRLVICNRVVPVLMYLLFQFTAYLKNRKKLFCETPVLIGTEPLTSTYFAYYGDEVNCVVDKSTSVSSQLCDAPKQATDVVAPSNGVAPKSVATGSRRVRL